MIEFIRYEEDQENAKDVCDWVHMHLYLGPWATCEGKSVGYYEHGEIIIWRSWNHDPIRVQPGDYVALEDDEFIVTRRVS